MSDRQHANTDQECEEDTATEGEIHKRPLEAIGRKIGQQDQVLRVQGVIAY